jgi:DNA-binding response OmpR family regulator
VTSETHILVVDDQLDMLNALQLILEGVGYCVIAVTSAQEALAALEQHPIDIILADIAMPHINGYQLFERVREQPQWATIPFLFLSARALDSDIRYGKALGVDDYLTKPIQPEDLLAAIEGKLRRRQHLLDMAAQSTIAVPAPPSVITIDKLRIDTDRHQIWLDETAISLSVREFALLEHLARHVGCVVATRDLIHVTHQIQVDDSEAGELLRPLIRSLRRKIAIKTGQPGSIETVRGLGYRMVEPT